jgi:hypothetical protein
MADDETTRVFRRSRNDEGSDTKATNPLFDKNNSGSFGGDGDGDGNTKIFRPTSKSADGSLAADNFVVEPVVGWLVIIDGPGKGNFVKLGFGMNSIGRSAESRVSIDFGDDQISRENHALLTYDTKNKKFYIQHGGGSNLTYLGTAPVLQPFELKGNEVISIGNTKLYFVAFCGDNFNWE